MYKLEVFEIVKKMMYNSLVKNERNKTSKQGNMITMLRKSYNIRNIEYRRKYYGNTCN
jgi:hypothetical protein